MSMKRFPLFLVMVASACGGTTSDIDKGSPDGSAGSGDGAASALDGGGDARGDAHVSTPDGGAPDANAHDSGGPDAARACIESCNAAHPGMAQSAQLQLSD